MFRGCPCSTLSATSGRRGKERDVMRKAALIGALLLTLAAASGWAGAGLDEAGANLRGCVDNHNLRMIPFEHANSFLPDGFKSADASVILFAWVPGGVPVPKGTSIAVSPTMRCDWSDWEGGPVDLTWIVIPVERPTVPGVALDPSYIDLYFVSYHTSGAKTRERFADFGFPVSAGKTEALFAFPGLSPSGSGTLEDENGTVVDVQIAGAAPVRSAFKVRLWFQTPLGLGFFTWIRSESTVLVGHLSTCSLRPGSMHAAVFGTTDCSVAGPSPQDGVGALFSEPTDFVGDFRFLDGVHVGDS
jgi:hypothetical protein